MTKRKFFVFFIIYRNYTHFFRNENPITIVKTVLFYDTYFSKYREISEIFMVFRKIANELTRFMQYLEKYLP